MTSVASITELRRMAGALATTAPTSAVMLHNVLDDLAGNGPISALISDHPAATSSLFCLRTLAGVRLLVLTGKAPQLAEHLADIAVRGGDPDFDQRTWQLFREAVLTHP